MDDDFMDMADIKGCPFDRDSPEAVLWLHRARAIRDREDHRKKAAAAQQMVEKHRHLQSVAAALVQSFDAALGQVLAASNRPEIVEQNAKAIAKLKKRA